MILAVCKGKEWPEQGIQTLDDSFNAGTRFVNLPQDPKDLSRLLFVKDGPIYFGYSC
jgi:hypothetical protein